MKKQYDDIIHLPHHVSKIRPQMSMQDRAAQFSPFAALTGYDAAIKETGRLTVGKVEMDESALSTLNTKFHILVDSMNDKPEVTFTYFKPDKRKAGGAYVEVTGISKDISCCPSRISKPYSGATSQKKFVAFSPISVRAAFLCFFRLSGVLKPK